MEIRVGRDQRLDRCIQSPTGSKPAGNIMQERAIIREVVSDVTNLQTVYERRRQCVHRQWSHNIHSPGAFGPGNRPCLAGSRLDDHGGLGIFKLKALLATADTSNLQPKTAGARLKLVALDDASAGEASLPMTMLRGRPDGPSSSPCGRHHSLYSREPPA